MPISMAPAVLGAGHQLALAAATPVPRTSGAHGLDKTLFLDVNRFARSTAWLHTVMWDYADYGLVLFGLLLVIGWWLARQRRDAKIMAASLWAGIGTIAAVGIAQPINHAVAEGRPWTAFPHALILAGHSTDFSFPSDHGVMAGAVTAGLLLYHRRLAIVSAVLGVLLCFARVYIGAHYPQDVVAGFIIGAAVVLIGWLILRVPGPALIRMFSRTPLRPLLTAGPAPLGATAGGPATPGAGAGTAPAGVRAHPGE